MCGLAAELCSLLTLSVLTLWCIIMCVSLACTEEAPHMQVLYAEHRMQDIDRNKDGFITLAEHIG